MRANSELRMTRQRQIILEELRKVSSHPTADELYRMVRRRLPRISLGTVYRNLELLANAGLAQRLELGGTQKRFDGDTRDHYHKRCIQCGRVDDVWIGEVAGIKDAISRVADYEIIGHRLEFIGICPQCKEKEVSSQKGSRKRRRKER